MKRKKRLRNIEYAVPTTDMYKTSAHQLSAEEVEQVAGYFSKTREHHIYLKEETNPLELPSKELIKIIPTNPNVKSFKGVLTFRSCFYNSENYSLEEKVGIFVSQALHFKDKKSYKNLKEELLRDFGRTNYTIFLEKGNVNAAVNMYISNTEPTKEFWELIDFVKNKGFKILVERGINKE